MEGILKVPKKSVNEYVSSLGSLQSIVQDLTSEQTQLLMKVIEGSRPTKARWDSRNRRYEKGPPKLDKAAAKLKEVFDKLQQVQDLNKEFNLVEIDSKAKRSIKFRQKELKVPLIWSVALPTPKRTIVKTIGGVYRVSTKIPDPIPEAVEAIKNHKEKFDSFNCWWVPNKFNVKEQPKPKVPDPILVGVVSIPAIRKKYFFELVRWIDESVENGWWSYEGY